MIDHHTIGAFRRDGVVTIRAGDDMVVDPRPMTVQLPWRSDVDPGAPLRSERLSMVFSRDA